MAHLRKAARQWTMLHDACCANFTKPIDLLKLAAQIDSSCRVPGMAVADIFLRPESSIPEHAPNTRRVLYVQALCTEGRLSILDVASAVLRYSSLGAPSSQDMEDIKNGETFVMRYTNSVDHDGGMLHFLMGLAHKHEAVVFGDFSVALVKLLCQWMRTVGPMHRRSPVGFMPVDLDSTFESELAGIRQALAGLLQLILDHPNMRKTLAKKPAAGEKSRLMA